MHCWWFGQAYLMLRGLSSAYRGSNFPLLLLVKSFSWLIPSADKGSILHDRASQSKSRLAPPIAPWGRALAVMEVSLGGPCLRCTGHVSLPGMGNGSWDDGLKAGWGHRGRSWAILSGYCHVLGNKDQCEHILGNLLEWAHSMKEVSPGLAPSESGVLSPWKSLEFFPLVLCPGSGWLYFWTKTHKVSDNTSEDTLCTLCLR